MIRGKLKYMYWLLCSLLPALTSCGQKTFDEMANAMADKNVQTIQNEETDSSCVFLDTRSWREYEVSHIPGAIWVGYDEFDLSAMQGIDTSKKIVLYCSVGYRSGKIGSKLQKAGYKVVNLWGGIFDWVNDGRAVENKNGKTTKVHAYNKRWGKWLLKGEKVYE